MASSETDECIAAVTLLSLDPRKRFRGVGVLNGNLFQKKSVKGGIR